MASKVSKDGTVTREDGTVIGRVDKRIEQGIFATALGVSMSGGGTPRWYPIDADGKPLAEYGYETRKRAVSLVEKNAEPLKVTDVKTEQGLTVSGRECITAWVSWQGHGAGVSRYPGEGWWVVDSLFMPGTMMPVFSNGAGTRYTRVRTLRGEQALAVTREAVRLGLLPEGSPSEPTAEQMQEDAPTA